MGKAKIALMAALVLAGAALRWEAQGGDPRTEDEMVYTRWAAMTARRGPEAIPYSYLVAEYNALPISWRGPSPLRTGYIGLFSLGMSSQGPQDIRVGVRLSILFSVLSLALLAVVGLRTLGFMPTLLGLALMAASPLDLLIARRAWQDGILENAALWMMLACGAVARRRRLTLPGALGLFAAALWLFLLKESSVVIVGLLGACLAGCRWMQERSWKTALAPFGPLALAAGGAVILLVALSGGAAPAWEAYRHCWGQALGGDSGTGNLETTTQIFEGIPLVNDPAAYRPGPWHAVLSGLFLLSPMTIGLAGWGMILAFRQRREHPLPVFLSVFCLLYLAVVSTKPLSLRLAAPVDLPLHTLAGWAAWRLIRERSGLAAGGTCAAVLLAAWADYTHFQSLREAGVADPMVLRILSHPRGFWYHPAP